MGSSEYRKHVCGLGSVWRRREDILGCMGIPPEALEPEYIIILDTFHNLGNLYTEYGRVDKAEKMYQRALEGYKNAWELWHPSKLHALYSLGVLYHRLQRLDEAEKMFRRALEGYEKTWGPEHTLTLDTVNNLGDLYKDLGRLEEAEEMHQRALKGSKVLSKETVKK